MGAGFGGRRELRKGGVEKDRGRKRATKRGQKGIRRTEKSAERKKETRGWT